MAIWSLTQERVDKLLKQIGEKELEIDALLKLSPKDIWTQDLDAFVEEWNTQLAEDERIAKKIANMDRRASKKLGIGARGGKATKKKRKMGDSDSGSGSDFGPAKKKTAVSKSNGGLLGYLSKDKEEPPKKLSATEALKKAAPAKPKQAGMLGYLTKQESLPLTDGAMDVDEPVPAVAPAPKKVRPAASKNTKKSSPVESHDESEEDIFAAVAKEPVKKPKETEITSRTARGATKKALKYIIEASDSDSDDISDGLVDVGSMVKTIGGGSSGRPMFSMNDRPGSNGTTGPDSANLTSKKPGRLGIQKSSPLDLDEDTTNYEGLMPQASPRKPAPRNVNETLLDSDDEDDLGFSVKKLAANKIAAKPVPKLVAKPASKPVTKATKPAAKPAVVAKKTTALSPAAKAYAAKLAKGKSASKTKPTAVDSDEDMDEADVLANDILSDEEEDEPTPKPRAAPAARAGRRAAAQPAKYVISDDDDDDSEDASEADDFDEDESE
jgi:DNA topoisomerase-2